MDTGFQHLSFASNSSSNAFEQLRKAMQAGTSTCTDTDLRLDLPNSSLSYFPNAAKGIKRKWNMVDGSKDSVDVSSLVLGLGPCSSDSKGSSATAGGTSSSAKETEEESSVDLNLNFDLHLGNEKNYGAKKSASVILNAQADVRPRLDLELCLSTRPAESVSVNFCSTSKSPNSKKTLRVSTVPLLDDDSASSLCQPGNCLSPISLLHNTDPHFPAANIPRNFDSVSIVPDLSVTTPKSSITCSSGLTQQQQRSSSSKVCQFRGCGKGARGASGLCIAHGGGRRCQKVGCHKGAEGRTVYCKAHGGGRRCQHLGCTKSAEGRTDNCIAHGGGRRCNQEGCTRAARGKSGLCIRHGGGKRCQMENCKKSAEGYSGLCISHGGGRRCQFPECTKGAQGSTMFCKAHGGGKRCTIMGCTKGAEGSTPFCKGHGGGKRCSFQGGGVCPKSVHGGTLFCVAHGGGKRCAMPECTKSARGRTDFCVRHGGGKRCKFEGCGKSAQGSTDFCKAHGGGKRCSWGQLGYEFGGQSSSPCDRFARGKTGLCAAHSALVQDQQVHGGGTLLPNLYDPKTSFSGKMKEAIIVEDMNVDVMEEGSTGGSFVGWNTSSSSENGGYPAVSLQFLPQVHLPMGVTSLPPSPISISEGRVHGGSGPISVPESRVHGGSGPISVPEGRVHGGGRPISVPEGRVHDGSGPISVPEGRVHGGSGPISVPEGRVHGGGHPISVPEGRVHGGSLMSLLAGNASFGQNSQNLDASGPSEPGKSYAVPRNWM